MRQISENSEDEIEDLKKQLADKEREIEKQKSEQHRELQRQKSNLEEEIRKEVEHKLKLEFQRSLEEEMVEKIREIGKPKPDVKSTERVSTDEGSNL